MLNVQAPTLAELSLEGFRGHPQAELMFVSLDCHGSGHGNRTAGGDPRHYAYELRPEAQVNLREMLE